jgi:hypothetical protein
VPALFADQKSPPHRKGVTKAWVTPFFGSINFGYEDKTVF